MKIKVYKFGGASIKDSKNIKNLAHVLKTVGCERTFMIISAIGKTTNALEEIVEKYFIKGNINEKINEINKYHNKILNELFPKEHKIFKEINYFFQDIEAILRRNKSPNYNFIYDQIVSSGELISTKIISEYLNFINIKNTWIDVRDYIKTDDSYRESNVNWDETIKNIRKLDKINFYVTQGFLGSDTNYFTTTLGREGSDYTAAIFAYCLDAEQITIWKDVPGVLNSDPRYFPNPKLLLKISYQEAIKLSYYGASVIHPKTIKPLKEKGIPLYVKSFINPKKKGTKIFKRKSIEPLLPCYIVKKNQILLSFIKKKFSFITEKNIMKIFKYLSKYEIKINLIQNLATNFSVCIYDNFDKLNLLIEKLSYNFKIKISKKVSLYTVRHYNQTVLEEFTKKKILLQQLTPNTAQWIIKE